MNIENRSRQLIKGTGIYAIGTFGTKLLTFLIVPLYTFYISTEDMGIYDLLLSTIQLLSPIVTMQISDAAYRWIIRDEGESALYVRSTMQVLIINCALAFGLTYFVNSRYAIPYCSYFATLLVLTRIMATIQKLLRALKNQKLFAVSGIIYSAIFLSFNVVLICFLGKGVESLFQSAVIATAITIIVIFVAEPGLRVNCFLRPDFKTITEFYKFSAPLVPNYLNWWVINSSDRYIVALFLGLSQNGILAIAHKFPTVLQMVLNLFTTSWQDVSVAEQEKNLGEYYTEVFRTFYRFVFSVLFFLIPATKIVVYAIMSPAYKAAGNCIPFYYLGTVFQSFASFYGVGYLRSKQTVKAFSTSIYGAIINFLINIALIRIIGLQAAAVSTFIGFLVMWLLREKQNRNELKIKLNWLEFTAFTAFSVFIAILSIVSTNRVNLFLSFLGILFFAWINIKTIKKIIHVALKKIRGIRRASE